MCEEQAGTATSAATIRNVYTQRFLNHIREKVDRYLFLGYAPPRDPEAHEHDGEALENINEGLQKKEFQELRRASQMAP